MTSIVICINLQVRMFDFVVKKYIVTVRNGVSNYFVTQVVTFNSFAMRKRRRLSHNYAYNSRLQAGSSVENGVRSTYKGLVTSIK